MISIKATVAYLAYALLSATFFLVLLFPEKTVKAYVDGRLAAVDPALSMLADSIRPTIPPGLKLTGVDLIHENGRLARFDDARLSPDLTTLMQDNRQFRFQAHLADGTINGRATLQGIDPSSLLRMEADLSRIHLEKVDAVQSNAPFPLSGILEGRLTHDGARAPAGLTSGLLAVSDLRITLKTPFFGISDLTMDQTDADFSVTGSNLRLKSLAFDGPLLEGKISGTIELARPFNQSRLNLTGNVKPRPEAVARLQGTIPQGMVNIQTLGTRGVTFRVRGAIGNPDVSMR